MMEPDYNSLDPVERMNSLLAFFSIGLGIFSMCGGIIPVAGIILSVAGIITGLYGRRSEHRVMASMGIVLSALGLLTSFVFAAFLLIRSQ